MDELVAFNTGTYYAVLAVLVVARGMDFLSTWVATPRLTLEANPLARRMGWKLGIIINVVLCVSLAGWPMPAFVIATTSLLVAARNFQSAWLMRAMGEARYQCWISEQLAQTSWSLYLFCLAGQTVLVALVGAALMAFGGYLLVPFSVGAGMITYAIAVAFYTLLAVWRLRRTEP